MTPSRPSAVRGPVRLFHMLVTGLALCVLVAGASHAESSTAARHTRAIELAREGRLDAALDMLAELRRDAPDDRGILYDYAVVLTWDGRDAEALALLPAIAPEQAPPRVTEALAKAARNQRRFELAVGLYRQAIRSDPQRLEPAMGLALTLADAGRPGEGLAVLEPLLKRYPARIDLLLVLAYVHGANQDHVQAAAAYGRVLALDPDNRDALRGRVFALADAGAAYLALERAEERPEVFAPEEHVWLRADQAAMQIRWGDLPTRRPAERFVATDRALASLDALADADWATVDVATHHGRRLLFDRMVALRDRRRMQEVIEVYERLQQAGVDIPDYVLVAAGDAFLYEEQPDRARDIYLPVLERSPRHPTARLSLFYAYVDLDDFDSARPLIEALAAEQPPWRRIEGTPRLKKNPRKLAADVTAGLGQAYADALADAQDRFEAMLQAAPANTDVRSELATVYRWRGWEERSLEDYDLALSQEPSLIPARVGRSAAYLELDRFPEAEAGVEALMADYPENKSVRRLDRAWEIHNRREFRTYVERGESSGGTESGNEYFNMESFLYSRPMDYNYRAFLHHYYAIAEFIEGTGRTNRIGAGIEYTVPRLRLTGELSGGTAQHTEAGVSVAAEYRASDHWRFGGLAEYSSSKTPLRAIRAGITANRAGASVVYRWHESQRASAGYEYFDFSDGNERHALSGSLERRLVNTPRYKLTGVLGLYGSTNKTDDVIYYSPLSDFSWNVTLVNDRREYRFYERVFNHRLAVGAGQYAQEGEPTLGTWLISYEHEWWFTAASNLRYGIQRTRRVFDGEPEYGTMVFAALNVRF